LCTNAPQRVPEDLCFVSVYQDLFLSAVSLSSCGQIASATPKSDATSSVERIGPTSPGGGSIGGGDLKALKAEKRMLKVKLRKFEEEYVKEHGHKPHSYQVRSINWLRTKPPRGWVPFLQCWLVASHPPLLKPGDCSLIALQPASPANVCCFSSAYADTQASSLAQEIGSIRSP